MSKALLRTLPGKRKTVADATVLNFSLSGKEKPMLKPVFVSVLFLFTILSVRAQTKRAIELSLIARHDRHADYVSNFAGRVYNDTNKLYGMSYGANISYRQKITNSISAFISAGYYRLGIDKIRGSMPFNAPGTRTARNIDYDDGVTNLLYGTSKYYYNNLAVTLGLSETIPLKDRLHLELGAEGIGYYSFSQRYELLNGKKYYSTHNTKPLEFGANATFGFLKEYPKFYVRPALLVPIYQNLKGDKVFYEDRNMNISKWFHGIGLTLRIGKNI